MAFHTIGVEAFGKPVGNLPQKPRAGILQPHAGAPIPPQWPFPKHGIEIPCLALEGASP